MGTKNIAITEEVYQKLSMLKASDESFSQELSRIISTKSSILHYAGIWGDLTEHEAEKIKRTLANLRKGKRLEEIKERVH